MMTAPDAGILPRPLPHHAAVIGAAGGLGRGILRVCRAEGIGFTAIVRCGPNELPIAGWLPVMVVTSLADQDALTQAFSAADAVLTALGVTSAVLIAKLVSRNAATVEASMLAAGVDRLIMINTLLASRPGKPASWAMRFFSRMPGKMGRGAAEQQAVVDALGDGAFASLRWTLVRAGVNFKGKDDRPVASADWGSAPIPGCPSHMTPWADGCSRRLRPMTYSRSANGIATRR